MAPPPAPSQRRATPGDYEAAATRAKLAEAERRELEVERLRAGLIPRADLERALFTLARRHRDAALAFPSRIAPELAATLGVDEPRLLVVLEGAIAELLDDLVREARGLDAQLAAGLAR